MRSPAEFSEFPFLRKRHHLERSPPPSGRLLSGSHFMLLPVYLATLSGLFLLAALSVPFAARAKLPWSVLLAILGAALSGLAQIFTSDASFPFMAAPARALRDFSLPADALFYLFLPILLFHGALGVDFRHLLRDGWAVALLAVGAVLISIGVIGSALWLVGGLALVPALIIGAICATTDPSAVISLFREIGVPARMTRLIEGESLLNDATAVAVYSVLLGALVSGVAPNFVTMGVTLSIGLLLGALLGLVGALVLVFLLDRLEGHVQSRISAVIVFPFILFLIGDVSVYISGVVAVVTGGIAFGLLGRSRFEHEDFRFLRNLLDQGSAWATGMIFLLCALLVSRLFAHIGTREILLAGIVAIAALLARIAVLWLLFPALARIARFRTLGHAMRIPLAWGGLRGAMTLALSLALLEIETIPFDTRIQIASISAIFTLATLVMQGATLRPLVSLLELDRLPPIDRAYRDQSMDTSIHEAERKVRTFALRAGLEPAHIEKALAPYKERPEMSGGASAGSYAEISDSEKLRLALDALVFLERRLLLEQRTIAGLPAPIVDRYLFVLDKMRDAVREEGRSGYLKYARELHDDAQGMAFARLLHNRAGLERPLARRLARGFHLLLVVHMLTTQLRWHADRKLRDVFGTRIADILGDIVSRRCDLISRKLDEMHLQYPEFAQSLEISMVARLLRDAQQGEIRDLEDSGIIEPAIARSLQEATRAIHARQKHAGRIDIEAPRPDLLRNLKGLADASPTQIDLAARKMRSVFVPADKMLIEKSDKSTPIYFIASGLIEICRPGDEPERIGRGSAFSRLRILNPQQAEMSARSLTHSHLFVLSVRDFRELMRHLS